MAPGMAARILTLASVVAWGCGGDGGASGDAGGGFVIGGDAGPSLCIDDDDDGFGVNCGSSSKRDCDDGDPSITNECFRCRSSGPGCPCKPGTAPASCKPPPIPTVGGYYSCNEGTTYCRDGKWSPCEAIGQYTFVAE